MRAHHRNLVWQGVRALATRRLRIYGDLIPYDFERLPLRKILNAGLVEASVLYKPLRPWGWPTHLMVEPSAHCNLSCTLCPVTAGLERPQGHMDFRTFKRVIDEIGEYLFTLLLWDWGEPFTNPAIYEMIAYAGGKGIKTISSSNGHLFARQDHADKVIRAGLDTLIVAVDGLTQETYARYRQGGQLDQALAGIRTLVARKRALGVTKPLVNFRFIVMRHNEHEIPTLKELARSLGVNAVTLKTFNPCYQDPYGAKEEAVKREDYLPQDRRYWRFHGDSIASRVRRKRNPCKQPWDHPAIHWNGVVCSCTFDPHEQYPLGDLRQQTFRAIWSGAPYRRLRRQFRKDWSQIPLCGQCTYAFEGGACRNETIAEAIFFPEPLQPVRHA
ncbi:MAG: radical protein [Deltaproteobacteria bacterium]|nr:radical protein [Deltaproteobacteria bacterium]